MCSRPHTLQDTPPAKPMLVECICARCIRCVCVCLCAVTALLDLSYLAEFRNTPTPFHSITTLGTSEFRESFNKASPLKLLGYLYFPGIDRTYSARPLEPFVTYRRERVRVELSCILEKTVVLTRLFAIFLPVPSEQNMGHVASLINLHNHTSDKRTIQKGQMQGLTLV